MQMLPPERSIVIRLDKMGLAAAPFGAKSPSINLNSLRLETRFALKSTIDESHVDRSRECIMHRYLSSQSRDLGIGNEFSVGFELSMPPQDSFMTSAVELPDMLSDDRKRLLVPGRFGSTNSS
jgi:hypothetical protein